MRILTGVIFAAIAVMPGAAHAQGDPDDAKGIVVEYCTKCHDVPRYSSGTTSVDAPPFQAIADDPETYPEDQLVEFLQEPHFPMEGLILSPRDIDNLVAFIKSLSRN